MRNLIDAIRHRIKKILYDKTIITTIMFCNGSKIKIKEKMPYEVISDDVQFWDDYKSRVVTAGSNNVLSIQSDGIVSNKIYSYGINCVEVAYIKVEII